ncbi:hypothetical protein D8M09_14590 [Enterobacter sp. R1(2018)]|nr:hypothetical protein D8M09_14590 [Enterobacter sp. R1(2018)]
MERNAHRLTLHSPAGEILPLTAAEFIDFAQIRRPFLAPPLLKRRNFTTIYCDVTTRQHHQ